MERIHIGQLVEKVFREEHPKMTVADLGRKLHCNRANVYDIFDRQTIDNEQLRQISIALNHDFFADLSMDLHQSMNDASTDFHTPPELHKQILYYNLMEGIGRLLNDNLRQSVVGGKALTSFQVNSNDTSRTSPLPIRKYQVYIMEGERDILGPHIHVISRSERFNIRIGIETGEIRGIVHYGHRDPNDTFADIVQLATKWLDSASTSAPGKTNREDCADLYARLNPPKPASV